MMDLERFINKPKRITVKCINLFNFNLREIINIIL